MLDPKRAGLRRMRLIATGLLLFMAILYVCARNLESKIPGLDYVSAFAEAAMVGALADWFAVVALFRHPLGIPIWHTAIIPRKKNEIGNALSSFVVTNFLTREVVGRKLEGMDLCGLAAQWLSVNHERSAEAITQFIPRFLEAMNDEDVQRFLHDRLLVKLGEVDLAPLAGNVLTVLTSGNKHQALLDEALGIAKNLVDENRAFIRTKIHEEVPLPDWKITRNVKDLIARYVAHRVVKKTHDVVSEVKTNPQHVARLTFRRKLEQLIVDLKSSPEYQRKGEDFKRELLAHPALGQYVAQVWNEIKRMILQDADSSDSAIRHQISGMISGFATSLLEDEALRLKLNHWLRSTALEFMELHKSEAGHVIEQTIQKWDVSEVTEKLELEVGRDLQFIRLNGTIVGGLVGLVLHFLSEIVW